MITSTGMPPSPVSLLDRSQHITSILLWPVIGLLTVFAVIRYLDATIWGIGFAPDSVQYLVDVKSIISNKNLEQLGSHWPPLYQILTAINSLLFKDLLESIKILHAILYVINILIFTYIIYRRTNRSTFYTMIGFLMIVTSSSFLRIHTTSWTEPLFCLFALTGLHWLSEYCTSYSRKCLIISALLVGLACITRYAGISIILAGILSILLVTKLKLKERLTACFYYVIIASAPLVIWILRNIVLSSNPTNRELSFHPVTMEKLRTGYEVLSGWLFIPSQYGFISLIGLLLLGGLYFTGSTAVKSTDKIMIITLRIYGLFILTYLLFLLISISFFDAHTPLDYRILIPVYLFFFQCLIILLSQTANLQRSKLAAFVVLILLLPLTGKQFDRQTRFVVQSHQQGIGFADKRWVQSGLIQKMQQIDQKIIVYTNAPEPFILYTDQDAKLLPVHTYPGTQETNHNFKEELNQIQEMVDSGRAVIAYFTFVTWRWYLPLPQQIDALDYTTKIYNNNDGFIVARSVVVNK